MNIVKIIAEMIDGYRSGGAEEALSEGLEETAEEATGKDL